MIIVGTILLTGFSYFDRFWFNPSGEAVEALNGSLIKGFVVKALVLPVSLRYVKDRLPKVLYEMRPSLVLGTGLAPATKELVVELASINRVSFQKDVDNYSVLYDLIMPNSPDLIHTTLPVSRIIEKCRIEEKLPIKPGFGTGLFLCNAVAYIIMKYGVEHNIPAGFIHVPPSSINMLRRETEHGVPLSEIVDSIRCIIEATLESG